MRRRIRPQFRIERKRDLNANIHIKFRLLWCIASYIGIFPVNNACSKESYKIKYKFFSFKGIFNFIYVVSLSIVVYHALDFMYTNLKDTNTWRKKGIYIIFDYLILFVGSFKKYTGPALFYGLMFLSSAQLSVIASHWPKIIERWTEIQMGFDKTPKQLKYYILALFITIFGFVEHAGHDVTAVLTSSKDIESPNDDFIADFMRKYSLNTHKFLFMRDGSYNYSRGVAIYFLSFIATIAWNFNNVFMIAISSEMIRLIKGYKMLYKEKKLNWNNLRKKYHELSLFVKFVNSHCCKLAGISLVSDLYFICAQLVEGISLAEDFKIESLFYSLSFSFLVFRTSGTLLTVANVYAEWSDIPNIIYIQPEYSRQVRHILMIINFFGFKIELLLFEINAEPMGINYLNFFDMSRTTLASIFGGVVTYEILLIQMQNADHSSSE